MIARSLLSTQNGFRLFSDRGDVFGWGNSEYGQLEFDGINQQINTPIHLKFTKKCDKIVDVAAGGSFCMALNGKLQ